MSDGQPSDDVVKEQGGTGASRSTIIPGKAILMELLPNTAKHTPSLATTK